MQLPRTRYVMKRVRLNCLKKSCSGEGILNTRDSGLTMYSCYANKQHSFPSECSPKNAQSWRFTDNLLTLYLCCSNFEKIKILYSKSFENLSFFQTVLFLITVLKKCVVRITKYIKFGSYGNLSYLRSNFINLLIKI